MHFRKSLDFLGSEIFGQDLRFFRPKSKTFSELGPCGSEGAHIKIGESSMAQDHFKTPPDPKMVHKNPKMNQKPWLGSCWDNLWAGMAKLTESRISKLFIHLGWAISLNKSSILLHAITNVKNLCNYEIIARRQLREITLWKL